MNHTNLKIVTTLSLLLLISFRASTQELGCKDFKEGVYYAEVLEPVPIKWKITRRGNRQTEEVIELPIEAKKAGYPTNTQYEIIEWIDDCTYRLRYDETKFKLSDTQRAINENGGALTHIVKVEGNCYYYVSTISINGSETSMEGKLCSE